MLGITECVQLKGQGIWQPSALGVCLLFVHISCWPLLIFCSLPGPMHGLWMVQAVCDSLHWVLPVLTACLTDLVLVPKSDML